MSFDK